MHLLHDNSAAAREKGWTAYQTMIPIYRSCRGLVNRSQTAFYCLEGIYPVITGTWAT